MDYGARWYDGAIGRWTAVDPLAEETPSWSAFNYVHGNPIRLIDPLGLSAEEKDERYYRRKAEYEAWQAQRDAEYGFSTPSLSGNRGNGASNEGVQNGGEENSDCCPEFEFNYSPQMGFRIGSSFYGIGDIGTGMGIIGEGIWMLGERRSAILYQQGIRRSVSGNYQLVGRNLSLFGNQPMTVTTKPFTRFTSIGRGVSNFGTFFAGAGAIVDTYEYSQGNLSGARYSYRLAGVGTSIGIAYLAGGPYGAAAGGIFFLGEKVWDMTQPIRNEISRQYLPACWFQIWIYRWRQTGSG